MANGTPTFTTPSWHEFQPSAIETSLANNVDNISMPSAANLLQAYKFERQGQQGAYSRQLDQMHQAQLMEFNANNQLARGNQFLTSLKDLAAIPGGMDALRSSGAVDPRIDTSGYDAGVIRTSLANNTEKVGKGSEGMALGGMTGPGVTMPIQQVTGQEVTQGPTAMERAAGINAAGRVSAANVAANVKPTGTVNMLAPGGNGDVISVQIPHNTNPITFAASLREGPGAATHNPVGGDNMKSPTPSPLAANPTQHNGNSDQSSAVRTVMTLRGTNPAAARDIMAAATSNGNSYKIIATPDGRKGLMGSSGTVYPMVGGQ